MQPNLEYQIQVSTYYPQYRGNFYQETFLLLPHVIVWGVLLKFFQLDMTLG